jgi:PAS domain S-box-containing protein
MDKKATYKAVFDSAPDGVIIADSHGKILMANKQVEKIFGYKSSELIGQEIELLIPKRYHKNHSALRGEYSAKPSPREMGASRELWARRKDESEFAVEISLRPIKLENRTFISATIRDVSEKKRSDSEIAVQYLKLENQNKELEQFTYIASHDLQEPLQTLVSFAELLKKEFASKLEGDGEKYLDFILKSSVRMKDLVKGLMEYSIIGKERNLQLIDCNLLVKDVLSDMGYIIKETDALILVNDLPKLKGYSVELRQLFQNLISNALKFTKKGIEPEIKIFAEKSGEDWLFSIKDNGIGIAKTDKEKIFTMFKRLHNRDEYEGTGIGLSHCKKIIELHSGNIWVNASPEGGSIFNFTIPKL